MVVAQARVIDEMRVAHTVQMSALVEWRVGWCSPFTAGNRPVGCLLPPRRVRILPLVKKMLRRYWGYLACLLLVVLWSNGAGVDPLLLASLSGVAAFYFLFRAPLWCCATTRDGQPCRKNATGLLMGCSYNQHKWQKLKGIVLRRAWRDVWRSMWANFNQRVNTLAALATVASGVVAVLQLLH